MQYPGDRNEAWRMHYLSQYYCQEGHEVTWGVTRERLRPRPRMRTNKEIYESCPLQFTFRRLERNGLVERHWSIAIVYWSHYMYKHDVLPGQLVIISGGPDSLYINNTMTQVSEHSLFTKPSRRYEIDGTFRESPRCHGPGQEFVRVTWSLRPRIRTNIEIDELCLLQWLERDGLEPGHELYPGCIKRQQLFS